MADVKLVTKFVDLGSTGGYGFALYGFRNIGGSTGTFGTLSETANGSSNTTTSYLYSTSTDIKEVYWADQATDTLYFTLDGNRSNSALIWAKLKIGSTTFTRSSATYSYNSSTNRTTWSWATSTNPFGSTTNGTDVSVEVIYDANTGHTSSSGNKTIASDSTSDETYVLTNASSSQKYRLIKSSGTIASGGGTGTVIDSRTGGGNLIFDYSNNELPPAGSSATYQLQVSGPNVSDTETESGFWINTTGQSNSITITREAAETEDTTPNDFSFTDLTNVARSTTQTSSTITVGGLSTGTSVTVSVTGGTYSKNSGSYTSSNGTASNGDTFSVRHTSSASFSTNTDTTLTIGNKDDTFRTTTLAQDTTPDNFVDFTDRTGAAPNTTQTSTSQTINGITGNVNVSVSGDGSPSVSINGGSFTSSPGTISNGQTIQARLTSSGTAGATNTADITIGTVTKTFDVTTTGSGGSGSGTSSSSSDYGIEIYDTNGTTTVLSPATRYITVLNDGSSVTIPAKVNGVNGSTLLQLNMTGLTTSNSDVTFTEVLGNFVVEVSRVTTGSNQGFLLENTSNSAITVTPLVLRY